MRNYDDYRIPDLIADLHSDASALKAKLELFDKLRRFFGVFSIVWSYVTVALFTGYGIMHIYRTGELALPIVTFAICGIYLVVNTLLLITRDGSPEKNRRPAAARRAFRFVTVILKIGMIAVTVASLIGITDDPSVGVRAAWCILSVFWLGITVAADVAGFFIRRVLKILKEVAAERVRRTKAAFSNTAGDITAIARTVKEIGSGIKNIFGVDKKSRDDKSSFGGKPDDDEPFGD